jgi:hypothetical protein
MKRCCCWQPNMPLYEYACLDHRFTRFLPLARFAEPQVCDCGKPAGKLLSAPMVIGDISPYQSPVDGKIINSRSARRDDLARNGCIAYEPGIRQDGLRNRAQSDERLERAVEDTIEGELARMPTRKRELLEAEVRAGTDVQLVRKSA